MLILDLLDLDMSGDRKLMMSPRYGFAGSSLIVIYLAHQWLFMFL